MNKLRDILIGPALPNAAAAGEKLSIPIGLAVLSSDVLSSCAYATDELLAVLVLGGSASLFWSLPICFIIIGLLAVLVVSYRQLIRAYPNGGGSYTVAKENLGKNVGLVAASGLLIDYVLTVSVSIAAGVDALTSAFPVLVPAKIEIGLVFLLVLIIGNLRGVRESGKLFAFPTLFFVITLLGLIIAGVIRYTFGHTTAITPVFPANLTGSVSLFLLLRAFSSGCTALTGTEAISNGVLVFKKPEVENARRTMFFMGIILGILFLGITFLARSFGILPAADQTVISQLAHRVLGNGSLYFIVQFATLLILILAANTSFADFPRVASMLGRDGYLPGQLSDVGSRLVYSNGIVVLGVLSGLLYVVFRANVATLIPLYAVGVFISFTLSQIGMVRHWYHAQNSGWLRAALINGTGSLFTALALIVIIITKFSRGAWFILLLIPVCLYLFSFIHRHYEELETKLSLEGQKIATISSSPGKHQVIVLIQPSMAGVSQAVKYARALAGQVQGLYLSNANYENSNKMRQEWSVIAPDLPLTLLPLAKGASMASALTYLHGLRSNNLDLTIILSEDKTRHGWRQIRQEKQTANLKAKLLKERFPVVSIASERTMETILYESPDKNRKDSIKHTLVMPVSGLRKGVIQAIQYANMISPEIHNVYIDCEGADKIAEIQKQWAQYLPYLPLQILPSSFREVSGPLREYIHKLKEIPDSMVTVVIPELITGKWWTRFLHRNMGTKLKNILLNQEHIPVLSFAYYAKKRSFRVVSSSRVPNQKYTADLKKINIKLR